MTIHETSATPYPHREWAPWPPSLDLHTEGGELVVHADLPGLHEGDVELSFEGDDLLVREVRDPEHLCRLPLPFPAHAVQVVGRPGHEGLEVRLRMP